MPMTISRRSQYSTGMVGDEESFPKSGILTSPKYPERYPNAHDSTQTIQVAEGKKIRWTWTNFYTEPENDFVQIVDEDGTDLTPKYWGSSLPLPSTSHSNIVHVKFHTNVDTQRTGWRLEWNEVDSKNDNLFLMNQNMKKD